MKIFPHIRRQSKKIIIAEALFVTAVVLMCVFWRDIHFLVGGFHTGGEISHMPDAEVVGIDLSHYQGNINWVNLQFNFSAEDKKLSAEPSDSSRRIDFIVAKATEGTSLVDRHYERNKIECELRGIPFSAYHYFKPNSSSEEQAEFFLSVAGIGKGNMIPVLDVEERGRVPINEFQDKVKTFAKVIEKHLGVKPLIYCNLVYYNSYFNIPSFKEYSFWIAAYSRKSLPVKYTIWQISNNARVGGIRGRVDLNVYHGSKNDFNEQMIL